MTSTQKHTLLLLGAGPRVGAAVADKFEKEGYNIALAARSLEPGLTPSGRLHIRADLANPENIPGVFAATEKQFGTPPNVVVYNVANRLTTPPSDPLSTTLADLAASRSASLDSAFIAAQHFLAASRTHHHQATTPTAFIYTGNTLNQMPIPGVMPFALGKTAAAMLIEYCANAYGPSGSRFYFADQRKADGRPQGPEGSRVAHAEMYWDLVSEGRQSGWLVTFVEGEGRRVGMEGVDFEGFTRGDYERRLVGGGK